jgi:ABC-type multidrug transport system fused ATPase/permease subunit
MDRSIFRYILRHSFRAQLLILAMTVASLPFLYASLELPKRIINDALANEEGGMLVGMRLDQVDYLLTLCGVFLVLVLINGAFKYVINVYKGIVGERMLRRLRYELYGRILRFPLPYFRRISTGEVVQMINAEVEPLGGFIGEAVALPAFQGGTLLTILAFMFAQDVVLGLAAVSLYPFQAYVIPKLQRQVNRLGKERVRQVRRLAERISETTAGARDLRANDATQHERARFSKELGHVFEIRFKIYKKKFFIKFLNNFLAQLAPFFFYSIGGYLVITGNLTLGALVAVIGAHEKLYAPWKELLSYYEMMWDAAIKYEQVVLQFDPTDTRDEALQSADPDPALALAGPLRASNLTLASDDGSPILDGVSFSIDLPARVAIVGPSGAGKEELTLVLANLLAPDAGRLQAGEVDLLRLPESVTGRRITYVGYPAHIFAGTIRHNLLFGLKHRPVRPAEVPQKLAAVRAKERLEAQRSGNSTYDIDADWIDYEAAGIKDAAELLPRMEQVLGLVRLDRDVYQLGLRGSIDAEDQPELAASILAARRAMGERLRDPRMGRLVEVFDPERYNTNATLAENLLFGAPLGDSFQIERLAAHPYVREVLEREGLTETLLKDGYQLASTMVELFADLPPDHEYFREYSFIGAEELPDYRALIGRVGQGSLARLGEADRERLLALTFKLVPARHRLDLLDDALQARIVQARHRFRAELPAALQNAIAFFDPDRYTAKASLQDNILFGKIAYGQAQATERISDLIGEVLAELALRGRVIEVGLQAEVGVGGTRLSLPQRQKLALARAILKRPEILIVYDATSALDPGEQGPVLEAFLEEFRGRTLIWALGRSELAAGFDQILVMQAGRVVEQGRYDDLNRDGSALHMIAAA